MLEAESCVSQSISLLQSATVDQYHVIPAGPTVMTAHASLLASRESLHSSEPHLPIPISLSSLPPTHENLTPSYVPTEIHWISALTSPQPDLPQSEQLRLSDCNIHPRPFHPSALSSAGLSKTSSVFSISLLHLSSNLIASSTQQFCGSNNRCLPLNRTARNFKPRISRGLPSSTAPALFPSIIYNNHG